MKFSRLIQEITWGKETLRYEKHILTGDGLWNTKIDRPTIVEQGTHYLFSYRETCQILTLSLRTEYFILMNYAD